MHPIVKEFIDSNERLTVILEKYHDKNQYLETVLLKLFRNINIVEVDQAFYLELDQAIIKGHPDTGVYMLFLAVAIDFTCRRKQIERANAIRSIGDSLTAESLPLVVQSYYLSCLGILKYYENNKTEGDNLLKKSISLINRKTPRYTNFVINLASMISMDGRLKELEFDDLKIIDEVNSGQNLFICVSIKLSNCIFVGDYKKGFDYLEVYKREFKADVTYYIDRKMDLLKLLSGDFNQKNYQSEQFKLYAKTCFFLSNGNIEEANKNFQLLDKDNWKESINIPFKKYLPLHLELSNRNERKARLIYHEMIKAVGLHYLDDFFLTRIQLLELNQEGACETFSRLMDNLKKYDAMNRLHFEMQFAKEIKPADILLLMSKVKKIENSMVNTGGISQQIKPINEKGVKLLIGASNAISNVKKLVKKFATLKEPVLITGETGTGKELVSRAIHEEGKHSSEPFLAINCGALTESLLESELFGYEAGAFTGAQKERKGIFEAAGQGTVFLDEFGDISPKLQVSLLRVLESNEIRLIGGTKTRTVNCKIVIATNIDLQKAVEEKKFREDLFFRLNRFDIKLPPLRERSEDIPELMEYFLVNHENPNAKTIQISKELIEILMSYRWPGNIRELKNEMDRVRILHSDKQIVTPHDFDFSHLQGELATPQKQAEGKPNKPKPVAEEDRIDKIVNRGSKTEQRHEFLLGLFKKYKKLTRLQIIEIADISPLTATKDLQALCKSGVIEKIMPTKSVRSHYFKIIDV
jgi:transcriptional regulator with PAS, ATPase and Fis domain